MVRRVFASSRYFIGIAVLGSFLSAVTLLVYGTLVVIETVWDTITTGSVSSDGAKHLAVAFLQMTDVFLLGTVLYIVALGLYELFIDPELPVPPWLHIDTLDDLKSKLVQVIVVLLGVTFLGEAVDWNGDADILDYGLAIALVIGALALAGFAVGKAARPDEPAKKG